MRNNKLTKLLIILFTAVIIVTGCSKNNIEPADEQILEEIKSEDSLGTGPNDHRKGDNP